MPILRQAGLRLVFVAFALLAAALPAAANPKLLVDMRSGEVLYAEDAGRAWYPASLTKLMTAFVAFEAISSGRVTLSTRVTVSARALKEPPAKIGLPVDTALTLENALWLMIVKSANDIAVAVAETVSGNVEDFVVEMNRTAAELGLTATHFVNPHGLHDPGQVTTARDLAILALNIRVHHPEFAGMFATGSVFLGKTQLESQNNLLTHFAGTNGMKTGFVCSSGLNIVATAERADRDLMAVVLGGASARERGEETARLMLGGFSGTLRGSGQSVGDLVNGTGPPADMRAQICGKEAKSYTAARAEAFPYGLEGQPSFLSDTVAPLTHKVSLLGILRDVPLPRPRPLWAPPPPLPQTTAVPLPRPRPFLRTSQ